MWSSLVWTEFSPQEADTPRRSERPQTYKRQPSPEEAAAKIAEGWQAGTSSRQYSRQTWRVSYSAKHSHVTCVRRQLSIPVACPRSPAGSWWEVAALAYRCCCHFG